MQREKIGKELEKVSFDFFYRFSRFEFALKENRYLKNEKVGKKAEASWEKFAKRWEAEYKLSKDALHLIDARPKRQVVGSNDLEFISVDFSDSDSDLVKVTRLLNVVRNNLFHGGKHGAEGWSDLDRTMSLLAVSNIVLDELAAMTDICDDFFGQLGCCRFHGHKV